MSSIKAGIVGAGGMAQYHYEGFVQVGAEVIAMADTDTVRAKAFGEPKGIKHIYSGLTEMLRGSPELDLISVITPNKFHKPLVLKP
jgi:predicted dehydrogenase